ncbi:hypothetical protein GCM10023087_34800 [Microbacterium rhizosphaerae]
MRTVKVSLVPVAPTRWANPSYATPFTVPLLTPVSVHAVVPFGPASVPPALRTLSVRGEPASDASSVRESDALPPTTTAAVRPVTAMPSTAPAAVTSSS